MFSDPQTITEEFLATHQSSNDNDYERTEDFTNDLQMADDPLISLQVDIPQRAVSLFYHFKNCSEHLNKTQKLQFITALPTEWSVNFISENFEQEEWLNLDVIFKTSLL